MSGTSSRLRYNTTDVAEIRRLARFYEGIAEDYVVAIQRARPPRSPAELQVLRAAEQDARRWAAQLRGRVADH